MSERSGLVVIQNEVTAVPKCCLHKIDSRPPVLDATIASYADRRCQMVLHDDQRRLNADVVRELLGLAESERLSSATAVELNAGHLEWLARCGQLSVEDDVLRIEDRRSGTVETCKIDTAALYGGLAVLNSGGGRALLNAFQAIETANPERLKGVFGNANWTDKGQTPDATLKNLIEHFSKHTLSLANVPEDELGNGYEYLIKQFADDSGHTAQEFYTNRTLVHLMAQMLEPKSGESVYDPTCGTGGMLISCLAEVKRRGGDTRTIGLYGQELITITAAIARMNLVLHGVSDFHIAANNTLSAPAFVEGDKLRTFDVVLANPPYSIKKWNRSAWESDLWGRNFLGTPPQGRADYAFFQHILKSMDPKTGRCAILFPHGVLFRNEEAEMRRKLVESDLVECVLGLGPGLFYNSPMEACVVVCRSRKRKDIRGKILFIDAVAEIARERAQSFLRTEHQQRILDAYQTFEKEPGFAAVVPAEDVLAKDGSLSIPLYVKKPKPLLGQGDRTTLAEAWAAFDEKGREFWKHMDAVVDTLDLVAEEAQHA